LIIDGHTHICGKPHTQEPVIWKIVEGGSFTAPFTRAEGRVDLLLRDMDERGVDKAVVMGFLDQISNEQLSELMREHPERIIGFAGVADPKSEDSVAMLKKAVGELGLRGLKLHPDLHSFSPADPEIVPPHQMRSGAGRTRAHPLLPRGDGEGLLQSQHSGAH
jgi:predicted TIM-barrel fold metal-dependent hydrolase